MKSQEIIFFDTEFTCFEKPELLSLGAIRIGGNEFYAEIASIPFDRCSEFVKDRVLPKFTGPQFEREELASRFLSWLGRFEKPVVLMSDSDYDRDLINALVEDIRCRSLAGIEAFGSLCQALTKTIPTTH